MFVDGFGAYCPIESHTRNGRLFISRHHVTVIHLLLMNFTVQCPSDLFTCAGQEDRDNLFPVQIRQEKK